MEEKKKNGAGSGAENNAGAEALENSAADLVAGTGAEAEAKIAEDLTAEKIAGSEDENGGGEAKKELAAEPEMHNVKIVSPTTLVIKRFFRSRLSVIGLTMFVVLFLFVFIGPLMVNWGETEVDGSGGKTTYTPHVVEFVDESTGESYTIVQVNEYTSQNNIFADPFTYGVNEKGETVLHVLGTDQFGRDIFVRLMYGGRVSLTISFMAVILNTLLGIILGGLAGYFGKWVDMVIMRIVDIINCIPTLPIMLIISANLDAYKDENQWLYDYRLYIIMAILTLISWTGTARLVRGQILFLREQEYMVAADALGMSSSRKIFRHLVINIMPQLIVSMTLSLGSMILYEATLGYLDLGVPIPGASWGNMINAAKDTDILQYHANVWMPSGICIIASVLAFNFIGDGLRDALDPKMKR